MSGYQNGRQQLIDDRVTRISEQFAIETDEAFLRFVHSLITGQSLAEFDPADLVDGFSDKGIDAMTFIREGDHVNGYIIQTKYTNGFSPTELLKVRNGLEWIFSRRRGEVTQLDNLKFRDKIDEYRSLVDDVLVSNVSITVVFATKGETASRPKEFNQEERQIREIYESYGFQDFKLLVLGAHELVDYLYARERRDSTITEELRIKYDTNVASIVEYEADEIKGLVCTVAAREIARIVNSDSSGMIFDANIRQFLGPGGAVNANIMQTCQDSELSHLFWFLNNGITIVCDDFTLNKVPDNPKVTIRNMQIVNGCQTASSLALAESRGKLQSSTRLLVRIYRAPNTELASMIVQTTNNQNRISSRNLKANDPIQLDVEANYLRYGYYYERKPGQYDKQPTIKMKRIVPNEKAAQAYLAVVLKEPSAARSRRASVWSEERYIVIFRGGPIEPYIFAWLLYQYTAQWLRSIPDYVGTDILRRKVARFGAFFIARVASTLWRKSDTFSGDPKALKPLIETLDQSPERIDAVLNESFEFLTSMIRSNPQLMTDLDKTLKSADLDKAITLQLRKSLDEQGV